MSVVSAMGSAHIVAIAPIAKHQSGREQCSALHRVPAIRRIWPTLVEAFANMHFADLEARLAAQYVFNLQQHPVVQR